MSYDISDYVDVKTRIELLYKKYENASIQFEFKGVMDGNPDFIWGVAYVYRNPTDPRPATGTCSELAQGKTAFTRGSELANLETSAIGRAIGALGIGLGKSMATKQEVSAAQARQITPEVRPATNEEVLDAWGVPLSTYDTVPSCAHGSMRRKTGLKKDGTPYAGYVCTVGGTGEDCKAKWDRSK
jgi:hypothetical protein